MTQQSPIMDVPSMLTNVLLLALAGADVFATSTNCSPRMASRSNARMGPPLPPTQAGGAIVSAGGRTQVQIELFLDLVCPFSGKMWAVVQQALPRFDPRVTVVLHQVVQPWHPQGTMVHEAALAVKRVAPEAYADYVSAVVTAFAAGRFTDEAAWGSTRAEIYDELLSIIGDHAALQAVDADAVAALLKQPEGGGSIRGNGGNGMTQEIKWACKFHRTRGVHVTPTVHVNGLEAGIVSSGWTEEQWCAFLEPMGDDMFTGSKLP